MRKLVIALLVSVMAWGGLTGPAFSASQGAAALSVSPDVGRPRIPITAHGSGFLAGETVDLSFDGALIGTAQTEPDGTFVNKVRVPSSALPGDHEVLAVGETSGLSASDTYLVQTDWARFSFDGANRWNRFENVLNPDNVGQLTTLWRHRGCSTCSVALAAGVVYMADLTTQDVTTVSAFDAATGTLVWSVEFPALVQLDPIVADGKVLLAFKDGSVVALDSVTGATVWSVVVEGGLPSGSLAADDRRLYLPLYRGELVALQLSDGITLWRIDVSPYPSGAAVWKGVVFVGGYSATYAIDAATGATIWTSPAVCGFCDAVTYSSGLVFTGYIDGEAFSALNASTGEKVWSVTPDHTYARQTAPAAADGVLFQPTSDLGWFYALDARSGEVLWSRPYESFLWASSPAVANGVVYIGNDYQSLVAVDAATGATLWEFDLDQAGFGPPIIADGRLFATGGGYLWAFGLPDG